MINKISKNIQNIFKMFPESSFSKYFQKRKCSQNIFRTNPFNIVFANFKNIFNILVQNVLKHVFMILFNRPRTMFENIHHPAPTNFLLQMCVFSMFEYHSFVESSLASSNSFSSYLECSFLRHFSCWTRIYSWF